jgi:hypothetical protein
MTDRRDHDHDPLLSDAESEAVGRRIHALAQDVEAPHALRARVAELQDAAGAQRRRGGGGPAWLRRPRIALPALGATLTAAAVAVALIVGGGAAGPTVDDAAALALAHPTTGAPKVVGVTYLDARVGGITFPNYGYEWPKWKATGTRHDTVGGRAATTVTYNGPKGDVGYTIVDGRPLATPDHARHVTKAGTDFAFYMKNGATVVTWRKDGHTCVLAGRGPGVESQLVKFASWE